MRTFGLLGHPLKHSFSPAYFEEKFREEKISATRYQLYDLPGLDGLRNLIASEHISGLNVTIPYKEKVIRLLDAVDPEAKAVGAVNCIHISRDKGSIVMKGYNTDAPAFEHTLKPLLQAGHRAALILGTGGSSRAVAHVLGKMKIKYLFVSRSPQGDAQMAYGAISGSLLEAYPLVINTTPLGQYPETEAAPELPYHSLSPRNLLYDLVYNPAETQFLKRGREQQCRVTNGLAMLHLQAEMSWEIWNSPVKK